MSNSLTSGKSVVPFLGAMPTVGSSKLLYGALQQNTILFVQAVYVFQRIKNKGKEDTTWLSCVFLSPIHCETINNGEARKKEISKSNQLPITKPIPGLYLDCMFV